MSRKAGRGRTEAETTSTRARAVGSGAAATKPRAAPLQGAPEVTALVSGPSLATARVESIDDRHVRIAIGGRTVVALREPALHPAVLRGAQKRGERVLVERGPDGVWVVLGALRTQPTPGIDVAEEFTIEADKVTVRAHTEVALAAETASIAVRAEGEIESTAPRIVSRAEGLHKITGRTLRLN